MHLDSVYSIQRESPKSNESRGFYCFLKEQRHLKGQRKHNRKQEKKTKGSEKRKIKTSKSEFFSMFFFSFINYFSSQNPSKMLKILLSLIFNFQENVIFFFLCSKRVVDDLVALYLMARSELMWQQVAVLGKLMRTLIHLNDILNLLYASCNNITHFNENLKNKTTITTKKSPVNQ